MSMLMIMGTLLLFQAQPGVQETWIDLVEAWRFNPDAQSAGLAEGWQKPGYDDDDWAVLSAGKRWEEQGFAEVDGVAWYRKQVIIPASWAERPVWLLLSGVNDACTVFCNGHETGSFGDEKENSVNATLLLADLAPFISPGQENTIAIRCLDWGGSGGLWHLPCALTCDPAQLPIDSVISVQANQEKKALDIGINLASLGNAAADRTLRVALYRENGRRPSCQKHLALNKDAQDAFLTLKPPSSKPSARFLLRMTLQEKGDSTPKVLERYFTVPGPPQWPEQYTSLKVRNNFVTELLDVKAKPGSTQQCSFDNPRHGWVFLQAQSDSTLDASVDEEPLVWRTNPDSGAYETMRLLNEGEHRLRVRAVSPAKMTITTMPEIAFCYYPCSPHIGAYGPYTWEYMGRFILPHVNTIITRGVVPVPEFSAWNNEGRQWISNASLPGLNGEAAPSADAVFDEWAKNPAAAQPGFSGMIVDEFLTASEVHYQAWGEAVRRLHGDPGFAGKTFYAWCGDLYRDADPLAFSRLLMGLNDRFSWERYLPERSSPEVAQRCITHELKQSFERWKKVLPGVEKNMVVCLGYLCAPPETVNTHPNVDYHVFLDMQFRLLATDPAFFGLYGIMEYMADYADEESIRFAHQLFRHYFIEGNTVPYTRDPYLLPHLQNPDFINGLDGWNVRAAEPGFIRPDKMQGFSWLEGRYPRTIQGDLFCRMRRSEKAPNSISQTLKSLQRGHLYSVKLISADIGQLDAKQVLGLSIQVKNAEILGEYNIQFPYPSLYNHEAGPYNPSHPAWFNWHRLVFRAEGGTAELTISDWPQGAPGGPAGQEIAFNFVEVQPFHAP